MALSRCLADVRPYLLECPMSPNPSYQWQTSALLVRCLDRAYCRQRMLQAAGVSQWGDSPESRELRVVIQDVDSIDSELLRRTKAGEPSW